MDSQLAQYVPVLILALVAIAFAGGTLVFSVLIGKWANKNRLKRVAKAKNIPYECGMDPIGPAHQRFSVKFYLVAMLFILFDIEAIFLVPWAVVFKSLAGIYSHSFVFFEMMIFIAVLLVGYIYVWKKGLFEWNKG